MLSYPEFKVVRTQEEIDAREKQLTDDSQKSKEEYAFNMARLYVLAFKIDPEDAEVTFMRDGQQMKDAAVAESMWLHGLKDSPCLNIL